MELDAIRQLAEAIREQTLQATPVSSSVAAVAFKAPQSWSTNTNAWFILLEASFSTRPPPPPPPATITQDLAKFHHVIQLLDSTTSRRVQAVLENPPPSEKYETLKSAILNAYEATQFQKDQELLNLNGLGDRKQPELLQHLRMLNQDPNTLFRTQFLNQLPSDVRRILAQNTEADLETMTKTSDRIMEINFPSTCTIHQDPEETRQETGSYHGDVNAIQKNQRPQQKFRSTTLTPTFVLCKYHSRFAIKARSCEYFVDGRPCAMSPRSSQGNDKASAK